MEQVSKRRQRRNQNTDAAQTPGNDLTELIPLEVVASRSSGEFTAGHLVPGDFDPQSVTRPGQVVTPTDVLESMKARHWQDGDGKYHRIDSSEPQHVKHQAVTDQLCSARTESQTYHVNDEEVRRTSRSELTQLASESAGPNDQRGHFAVERQQRLPVDHEREATLHSERLALVRDRELLILERELLVRERELLAAERRQFFLDRTAHAERSFAQTGDTSDTLAAVNRQFGIPGPESHPEIAKATASTLAASWKDTPSVTARDHASVLEIDREPRYVDPTSEDPEIAPGESDQRDSLDFEKPIDDLRSQLAKLFEMPSAERPAATESIATLDQIRLEIKSVEEIQSDAEKAVDSEVEDPGSRQTSSEDSIEEFMARLLARSASNIATRADGNHKNAKSEFDRMGAALELSNVHEQSVTKPSDLPHQFVEQKHKPDKQAEQENLPLFRQVANASARSALEEYSRRRRRKATMTMGILLVVSLSAASFVLFTQNQAQSSAKSTRFEVNSALFGPSRRMLR